MELTDAARIVSDYVKYNKYKLYFPYGHPQTLPGGELYERKIKLGEWEPWSGKPWQSDFHAAGKNHRERMTICANRVGKCLTRQSLIDLVDGTITTVGTLIDAGVPFEVWAWNGKSKVKAKAVDFIKKSPKLCYRVWLENGEWFECAANHRVLTDDGWHFVGTLLKSAPCLPHSSSDIGLLAHVSDVRRYSEITEGYQFDYLEDCRLYDGQLPWDEETVQYSFPLEAGAQRYNLVLSCEDGLVNIHTSSPQQASAHPSMTDDSCQTLAQSCESLIRAYSSSLGYIGAKLQEWRQFLSGLIHEPQQVQSKEQCSLVSPDGCANNIIAYQPIGAQEVFDFTIDTYFNYIANGVVHHNTVSAAYETSLHMTGDYPDWWDGKRFDRPVLVWTGSPTNETSRDIVQKELIGGTTKEQLGTGFIPREKIVGRPKMRQAGVSDVVDQFKVRHISGGISVCTLKTYEQGWRKWQGTAPEVVWLDEEPEDFKVYTESLTRLLTSKGIMMITFTPLLGQTDLVIQYQNSESKQVWMGTATWEDAPHLNREARDSMIESYPDHEIQARTQGVPMMGEGRIFLESEDNIIIDPIPLKPHWALINGLDFGIDHPFGLAKVAWDRDKDIIYLYECHREKNAKIPQQAARIKKKGQWIPVSWPHDGANRDKGSGRQLHKFYRDEGVNMLGRSARYDNKVGGAQAQWPIIEEIKERERTGRFKIFSTCIAYLEERRNYHVKSGIDGKVKIVDRRDDTLKACFYAIMMKRYACTQINKAQSPPPRSIMSVRH